MGKLDTIMEKELNFDAVSDYFKLVSENEKVVKIRRECYVRGDERKKTKPKKTITLEFETTHKNIDACLEFIKKIKSNLITQLVKKYLSGFDTFKFRSSESIFDNKSKVLE